MKDPRRMGEADLQRAILQTAELMGYRAYHVVNVSDQLRNSTSVGFPDLCMVHPERRGAIFAELKDARRKVTRDQQLWLDALSGAREEHYVWRPKDWKSGRIIKILEER